MLPVSSDSPAPLPPGVWQVEVFGNLDLSGAPLAVFALPATTEDGVYRTRLTPALVQQQVGMPSVYSLRLRGVFPFTEGEYAFHCLHDDGCRVYVEGENWIDAWWDGAGQHDLARPLSAGEHEVVIEFYDKGGVGNLEIWWERR